MLSGIWTNYSYYYNISIQTSDQHGDDSFFHAATHFSNLTKLDKIKWKRWGQILRSRPLSHDLAGRYQDESGDEIVDHTSEKRLALQNQIHHWKYKYKIYRKYIECTSTPRRNTGVSSRHPDSIKTYFTGLFLSGIWRFAMSPCSEGLHALAVRVVWASRTCRHWEELKTWTWDSVKYN